MYRIKITEKKLAILSVMSIAGLLFIWVLPHTIILRHLFLILGFLSAIGLICYHWSEFKSADLKLIPLFCILALFVWMLVHYFFLSLNPELELSEIKGLWMRSLLGVIAAMGLGIALVRHPRLRPYFCVSLFFTPFINVTSYCWASYLNHAWVMPIDFVGLPFKKIDTAYFGAIAAAFATGKLILLLSREIEKHKTIQIFGWLLGLALILISALLSNTKNGIAIALGLCVFLVAAVLIGAIRHGARVGIMPASVLILVACLSVGVWESHKSLAYKGWDTVVQDAALGIDIDSNKQWQKDEGTVPTPLNRRGEPAALNTYTRFAYAAAGVRLIAKYPLGYGSINESFWGLLDLAQIPHDYRRQTHSGWIDFGLAYGVPGLVFVFAALISIILIGSRSKSSIVLPWIILCATLIPFGLIAEIAWKQYFEATLFFIALSATIIALTSTSVNSFHAKS